MHRAFMAVIVFSVVTLRLLAAEDSKDADPIKDRLTAAKETYKKSIDRARAGLVVEMKKKELAAQKAGDLKLLEKLQAETRSFEERDELPKSVSLKVYDGQVRIARMKLEDAYSLAVKQYTKAGEVNLAKAVQQSLDEFRNNKESKVSSLPAEAVVVTEWPSFPLTGHVGSVKSVAITGDGKFGFSTGGWINGDGSVRKWNLETAREVFVFRGHEGFVEGVACDVSGSRVLTGGKDRRVRLLDGNSGTLLTTFAGHELGVNEVGITPDGKLGVSTSDDYTVRWWDLEKRESRGVLSRQETPIGPVAVSRDGRFVAVGGWTPDITICSLRNGREVRRIQGCGSTADLAFSPDGQRLVSSHARGLVVEWDASSGEARRRLRFGTGVRSARYLSDGERLAVAMDNQSVLCVNLRTGNILTTQTAIQGSISKIALSTSDDRLLVCGSQPLVATPQLCSMQVSIPNKPTPSPSLAIPRLQTGGTPPAIAEWVLQMGGSVKPVGSTEPIKSTVELPERWTCELLSLERCPLFPGEIKSIGALYSINRLFLSRTNITDDDLVPLQALLEKVIDLKLGHTNVTDRTMELLASNRNMGQLDVELTGVTDVGLASVLSQNRLKLMCCDSRQFTARLRPSFRVNPPVQWMVLVACEDAPLSLTAIEDTPPERLILINNFRDKGFQTCPDLSPLSKKTNPRLLQFKEFRIKPENVQQLAALKQLEELSFIQCSIPPGTIDALKQALPTCKIKGGSE